MKNLIYLLLLSCFVCTGLQAQEVETKDPPLMHYTIGELDALSKMELTDIYMKRVAHLNKLMPFISFDQEDRLNPDELINVKIPDSKSNLSSLEKVRDQTVKHNEMVREELMMLIPYADKKDIVNSILFVQGIIESIKAGAY